MQHTQLEIEQELSDVVPWGARKHIARVTGIYPAIVSAYFNADDHRKSPQYTTLQIQSALDNSEDPLEREAGEAHWQKMQLLREMNMPRTRETSSVDEEVARHQQEATDVVVARLGGRSLYRQLVEIDQAIKAAQRTKKAIIEAINNEKEAANAPVTRYSNGHRIRRAG